jgi:hypothetical protein
MLAPALALLLAAGEPPTPEQVDHAAARLLARAAGAEPSALEVQRAAATVAATPGAASWRRRARLAALVPRVSAELRVDDRSYRMVGLTSSAEVDYTRYTPTSAVALRLTWDLPEAVFAETELRAAAQAQLAARLRAEAVERATRLYFERQRLRLAVVAEPPESPRQRAEQELRLEELAAELDVLTGGLYSGGAR